MSFEIRFINNSNNAIGFIGRSPNYIAVVQIRIN